jgi:hypothetical protein
MSWIAPNSQDVLSEMTQTEAAKFTAIGGTADKVVTILDRTVAEIRGYINAGGYELDSDQSLLPNGLIADAVAIARWKLVASFPDLKAMQSDARKDAYDFAMKKLALIAAQKWPVELPDIDVVPAFSPNGNWNAENKLLMRTHPVPKPAVQGSETADSYANS